MGSNLKKRVVIIGVCCDRFRPKRFITFTLVFVF